MDQTRGQLPTEKDCEFRCDECNARCTEGPDGTEYGHMYGCPDRPDFPNAGGGGSYYDGGAADD